jgi:predicted cobalt transporter CbtA
MFGAMTPLVYFFTIIGFAAFAVEGWAFVDAITRPAQAFVAVGKQSKQIWLLITGVAAVVGLAFAFLGDAPMSMLGVVAFVASAVYLTDVRPKVKGFRKSSSGTHQGPYGPW